MCKVSHYIWQGHHQKTLMRVTLDCLGVNNGSNWWKVTLNGVLENPIYLSGKQLNPLEKMYVLHTWWSIPHKSIIGGGAITPLHIYIYIYIYIYI